MMRVALLKYFRKKGKRDKTIVEHDLHTRVGIASKKVQRLYPKGGTDAWTSEQRDEELEN